MIPTAILINAILALGVTVMVVAPLAWAILTQSRDRPGPVATDGPSGGTLHARDARSPRRPPYAPALYRV